MPRDLIPALLMYSQCRLHHRAELLSIVYSSERSRRVSISHSGTSIVTFASSTWTESRPNLLHFDTEPLSTAYQREKLPFSSKQ